MSKDDRRLGRDDLEAAFKGVGGRTSFLKWARANSRQFFQMFAKDLLAPGSLDPPKHAVDPQAGEKLKAMTMRILSGIIAQRQRAAEGYGDNTAPSVTMIGDDGVPEIVQGAAPRDIPQTTAHGTPQITEPASVPAKPKPADVVAAPLTPVEARRLAMQPLPQLKREGPSSTELFLQYSDGGGGQRMNWSPPPGWSGG
jgi:hypothetical protein